MEFHTRSGPNAVLSVGNRFARRSNSDKTFNGAIVFSSQPLEDDRLFEIRIEEKAEKWDKKIGFMIGVTSQQPDEIDCLPVSSELYWLGDSFIIANGNVYSRGGVSKGRFLSGDFKNVYVGCRIGVLRKRTGELHLYRNGVDKGEAFHYVPGGCYAALDLYGNCAAVSIVNDVAIPKHVMVSVATVPWRIADFKDRIPAAVDLAKPAGSKTRQNKKLKTSAAAYDDDAFIPSARFTHKAVPGIELFFRVYPGGYGKDAVDFVSVELCVEKSGRKSSATAPVGFFYASFASANGESTLVLSSQTTTFIGSAVCVIDKFVSREEIEKLCKHDGSITLSGKVCFEAPPYHQADILRRSYESGAFSDFKIAVENETAELAVHKHVLAASSPVFTMMLNAQYDEVTKGKFTIKESSLDAVKAMLQFVYGDPLRFDGLQELSIEVLKLAEQYHLYGLKHLCVKSLREMISKENVLQFAQIADLYSVESLKKVVFQFIFHNETITMFG